MVPSPFLKTEEAAAFLGLSPRTLERLRFEGRGPTFRKHGRIVVYTREALDAWSAAGERRPEPEPRSGVPKSR
jgi:predicted DNA-binding transcriptional regulator AlpA